MVCFKEERKEKISSICRPYGFADGINKEHFALSFLKKLCFCILCIVHYTAMDESTSGEEICCCHHLLVEHVDFDSFQFLL